MTSEAKDAQACAVPLVERLLSVPKDAREMIEVGYCHHRNVPYGAMCHEAAARVDKQNDKIAALEAQVVELRRAVSLFIGVSGPKANEQMLRDTFVEVLSKTAADFEGKCVIDAKELSALRKDREFIDRFESTAGNVRALLLIDIARVGFRAALDTALLHPKGRLDGSGGGL